MDDRDLVAALARGLVLAIGELTTRVLPPVEVISLELYPWHGYVALSVLDGATPPSARGQVAEWTAFEAASSVDRATGAVVVDEWAPVAAVLAERWHQAVAVDVERGPVVSADLHRLAACALTSAPVAEALRSAGWAAANLLVVDVDDPTGQNHAVR